MDPLDVPEVSHLPELTGNQEDFDFLGATRVVVAFPASAEYALLPVGLGTAWIRCFKHDHVS